ncbi:MAG: alpha amylase C-terminal domain-containing protein, partial [Gemmatimonadota bacterium]
GVYMFTENYTLPLSHDEVVHGKGSLLGKMPGDDWQKRANLRLLLSYMYGQPGKKLLFMGGELGQAGEWAHEGQLQWDLLAYPGHQGIQALARALNRVYREHPALHAGDVVPEGFEWVIGDDRDNSVLAFLRRDRTRHGVALCVYNFTPVPRRGYRIGVPRPGDWTVVVDTDRTAYGRSGHAEHQVTATAEDEEAHGRPYSLELALPPLAGLILVPGVRP